MFDLVQCVSVVEIRQKLKEVLPTCTKRAIVLQQGGALLGVHLSAGFPAVSRGSCEQGGAIRWSFVLTHCCNHCGYYTLQYNAVHCKELHCTVDTLYCTSTNCAALCCTMLCCTARNNTALYCTVMHRTVLQCPVQYSAL